MYNITGVNITQVYLETTIYTCKVFSSIDKKLSDTPDLGYSKTYKRELYEDQVKLKNYKNDRYSSSKTIIDFTTGNVLHRDIDAAKNKYGKKNFTNHISQTDHDTPLKFIHEVNKPIRLLLTDEDIKIAANRWWNLFEVSAHANTSKQDHSSFYMGYKSFKDGNIKVGSIHILKGTSSFVLIESELITKAFVINPAKIIVSLSYESTKNIACNVELAITDVKKSSPLKSTSQFVNYAKKTLKNTSKKISKTINNNKSEFIRSGLYAIGSVSSVALDGAVGAIDGAAPLIIANTITDAWKVAKGEKTVKEAVKENATMVMDVGIAGAGNALLTESIKKGLENSISDHEMLKFVNSAEFGQVVFLSIQVARLGIKYLNGEINGEEMLGEITTTTISFAVSKYTGEICAKLGLNFGAALGAYLGGSMGFTVGAELGWHAGKFIGETVGYMVTAIACNLIIETVIHRNDYKKYEAKIKRFTNKATAEMQELRNNFENLVQEKYGKWDETINNSINVMTQCAYMEVMNTDNIDAANNAMKDVLKLFGFELKYTTNEEFLNDWGKPLKLSISF